MKNFHFIILSALIFFAACKEDEPVTPSDNNNDPVEQEKSTMDLFAQEWVLSETFKNDVQETSNGTGEYLYTAEGAFFYKSRGNWEAIANYTFNNSDSSSISVLFHGMSNPVVMDITTLTEHELKTEFTSNGNKLNYNYTR